MKQYHEICSSRLNVPGGTYIYDVVLIDLSDDLQNPGELRFVASASNDSLVIFGLFRSGSKYRIRIHNTIADAHQGLSCLQFDNLKNFPSSNVVTAGRDGLVKFWNLTCSEHERERFKLRTPCGKGISAIAQASDLGLFAVGTELLTDGPGDVAVYIWNLRATLPNPNPVMSFQDSHTDTITALSFHGYEIGSTDTLVSASTDGLVNVWDLKQENEEDAIRAVVNTGSAVQHMAMYGSPGDDNPNFHLFPPRPEIGKGYAVSQDEILSKISWSDDSTATDQKAMNLRDTLHCDYVVAFKGFPSHAWLVVGAFKTETTQKPFVDVYTLSKPAPEDTSFRQDARLVGAHGEEIVRGICKLPSKDIYLTCGEDGFVRVWKVNEHNNDAEMNDDDSESVAPYRRNHPGEAKMPPKRTCRNGSIGDSRRYRPY